MATATSVPFASPHWLKCGCCAFVMVLFAAVICGVVFGDVSPWAIAIIAHPWKCAFATLINGKCPQTSWSWLERLVKSWAESREQ